MEGKVERIKEEEKEGNYGKYTTQNFTVEGVWYNGYKKIELCEGDVVEFDFSTEKWGNKIVKDTLKIVDSVPAEQEQTQITPNCSGLNMDLVDEILCEGLDIMGRCKKGVTKLNGREPKSDGEHAETHSLFIYITKQYGIRK